MNILLIVALLSTLGLLLTAGYKGWREEHGWHAGHTGKSSAIIADITVNLGGTPKQEHCLTCHPEGRPAVAGAIPRPPATTRISPLIQCMTSGARPVIWARAWPPTRKYRMAGWATRPARFWLEKIFRPVATNATNLKPLKGAEQAWQGSRLFSETACDTCHTTGGRKGASYGPDLSDAGSFLGLKEIQAAIENPKADLVNSIMPKFPLSPDEIKAISYFLKSRVKEPVLRNTDDTDGKTT